MSRLFGSVVELVFAALVAVLVIWLGFSNAMLSARLVQAQTQLMNIAAERASAEARVRKQEREHRDAIAEIERQFVKEMDDAQIQNKAVVAAVRADNLRLRSHWQGCIATAELSAAAAAAARADADADLRAAGAADLVQVGAECDARIRAHQSIAISQQGAD